VIRSPEFDYMRRWAAVGAAGYGPPAPKTIFDVPTIKIDQLIDQLLDPDAHTIFTECLTSGMTESTTV
jgi:hypothetical protein